MQQLYGTRRDSEIEPVTIEDSERYATTPLDRRVIEGQLATMRDSERHTASLGETASDHKAL